MSRRIRSPSQPSSILDKSAGSQASALVTRTGRPVVIVHGRADSLIPVNHGSRAYYAVNQRDRGNRDELRYYELEHGNHFDAMLAAPGGAESYVPMQPWMVRGLDALHAVVGGALAMILTLQPVDQQLRGRLHFVPPLLR